MGEVHNDIVLRYPDHDVTPDFVRVIEPTYVYVTNYLEKLAGLNRQKKVISLKKL